MTMTIGKVSLATGLTVETIRYYEKEGILDEPTRSESGYRLYQQASIARLKFVQRAKRLGFSLAEVRNLLRLSDGVGNQAEAKLLTEEKIAAIESRVADLLRMKAGLVALSQRCPGESCEGTCPIIGALSDEAVPLTAGVAL